MMDRKHRGAASEMIACGWLLTQGYEVFRNVSQHGEADLFVISPDGQHILVDVTTYAIRQNKDGTERVQASKPLKFNKIKILYVNRDTGFCAWREDIAPLIPDQIPRPRKHAP